LECFNGFVQNSTGALHGLYKIFTPQEMNMQLTVSAARQRLGEVVTRVQDPNECIVMTRHGTPVAAVVSMANLQRIWQIEDEDEDEEDRGMIKHPLNKNSHIVGAPFARVVQGLRGKMVTPKEAALQVRTLQLTRAEERRILAAGGLEPVEGGELGVTPDNRAKRRRWLRSSP
jgi:prevent-host-death family protein